MTSIKLCFATLLLCGVAPSGLLACNGTNETDEQDDKTTVETEARTCVAGEFNTFNGPRPDVVEEWSGDNGVFVDACDEDGNLTQYECAADTVMDMDSVTSTITGEVIPPTFDCGGACDAGACDNACPKKGTTVTLGPIAEGDERINIVDEDGLTYECDLVFEPEETPCLTAELEGAVGTVNLDQPVLLCSLGNGRIDVTLEDGTDCNHINCQLLE